MQDIVNLVAGGGAPPSRRSAAMKASIVIPTMGGEALARVVKIYLETSVDVEILVMVDRPDLAADALLPGVAADPRLRIAVNRANIGLTRTLNRALDMATGDIIIRNDDDDEPSPRRVERILDFFVRHPDCDLVFSHARGVDRDTGASWLIGGPTTDADIRRALEKRNFIVHSSLAFRAESVRRIGGYDATFRYAQDYELYLRAMRAGLRFGAIAEPLVTRDYHAKSITVSRRRRQMLYSFAARLIHDAERADGDPRPWRTIAEYLKLLLVPDWLRAARRRLGRGK